MKLFEKKYVCIIISITFCFLFLLSSQIFSQNLINIKGKIIDKSTLSPIKNINISINPGNYGGTTNSDGFYNIKIKSPGQYTLKISHINYQTIEQNIEIATDKSYIYNFELEATSQILAPVVIEASIERKEVFLIDKLKAKQIEESAVRDIGDFLRSVPNIAAIRKAGTGLDPVVRGFKYSQLNIQLDNGMKIEGGCPNRMDPTASHIEPEDVESIEVFKGPYALKYGPSLGGVVNIITNKPQAYDKFEIHIKAIKGYESNWNGNKEYLRLNGGNKKIFFDISGTKKDYGNYKDGNGNKIFSEFKKNSYKAQLGVIPVENHLFNLSYGEYHAQDVRFPALQMDEREDNTQLISLDYKGKNFNKWFKELKFKLYKSKVEHLMDNFDRGNSDTVATSVLVNPINKGGKLEGLLSFNKHNVLIGVDYENICKDGTRTKNMIGMMPNISGSYNQKIEKLWSNAKINNFGVFAEYNSIYGAYEAVGVLRADFNSASTDDIIVQNPGGANIFHYASDSASSNYTNISAAIGITRNITDNLSLSLAFGRGVRSPDMLERYIMLLPVGYDNFDYVGNPKLKPEANNEVDLSLKYNNSKVLSAEINVFYAYVANFIMGIRLSKSTQSPLTANVMGVKKYVNVEPLTLKGFEIAFTSSKENNFIASVSAAYTMATMSEIKQYITDSLGVNIIDDKIIFNDPLLEIPPLETNISFNYKFFENKLNIHGGLRIVASQKRVSQAMYELPTNGFMLANISLTYKHNNYFSTTAGVNNLFNKAYYEHLNRRIVGSRSPLYEPGRVLYINLVFNI